MMFSKYLSRYLAHYLVKNKFIGEEEYSIYQYCIDYIIEMGIFFLILENISILLGSPLYGILFFSIITPLRSICGGVHASSKLACTLLSYFSFFFTYFLLMYLDRMPVIYWVILFVFDILFLFLAPTIVHNNRSFHIKQKRRHKQFRYVLNTILLLVFIISVLMNQTFLYHIVTLCVSIVVISMISAILISSFRGGYSYDF